MPWWPISYLHLRSICAPVWLLKVTRTSSLSNELLWQWEDDSQCKHSFQKICPARHLKVLPCVWLIIWNCILYRLYPPLCPYVLFVSSFKLLTLILTISPNKLCYCHQSTDEQGCLWQKIIDATWIRIIVFSHSYALMELPYQWATCLPSQTSLSSFS